MADKKEFDIHIRFTKEEYDKVRLLAYYANKSKAEVVRVAVRKLNPDKFKEEVKSE